MRHIRYITAAVLALCFIALLVSLAKGEKGSAEPLAAIAEQGQGMGSDNVRLSRSPPAAVAQASDDTTATGKLGQTSFEAMNHRTIEFYGRVVDQYDTPVAGAAIRGVVLVNTGEKVGRTEARTHSDDAGFFSFRGLAGHDLGIGIAKEGYEFRARNSSFSYSLFEAADRRHVPDPKNAVVFRVWKLTGAEPLIWYKRTWLIPVNADSTLIDLESGRIVSRGGDLALTVTREPQRLIFGEMGFAWRVKLDVVGGGVIRAPEDDYYNLAPESGYETSYVRSQAAVSESEMLAGREWAGSLKDVWFVSSQGGKNHSRVSIYIDPLGDSNEGDNRAIVTAEVWLNTNRSRNLEFNRKIAKTPRR